MADETELASNVLEFARKSFGFDRSVDWEGTRLALFHRTETESESQFRPRLVRLELVVPSEWVVYDLSADLLRLGRDGTVRGPRGGGEAVETAGEPSEFEEQGIEFARVELENGNLLYAPREWIERLTGPVGRERLGLSTPPTGSSPSRNGRHANKRGT